MFKNIISKISVGGYVLLGGALLSLVSMIIAVISCSPAGFAIVQLPFIILFSIAATLLLIGAVVLSALKGEGILPTLMIIGAIVLLTFTLFNMIDGKQDVLGTVMFSDLEKGHAPTEFACYVGFTSMIFYIITIVITAVGSFLPAAKKEKAEVAK